MNTPKKHSTKYTHQKIEKQNNTQGTTKTKNTDNYTRKVRCKKTT